MATAMGCKIRRRYGVADGHSNGNAVQRIVNKKRCRCFMLCTAATYKSRKKVEMGAAVAIVIFKE